MRKEYKSRIEKRKITPSRAVRRSGPFCRYSFGTNQSRQCGGISEKQPARFWRNLKSDEFRRASASETACIVSQPLMFSIIIVLVFR